MGEWPIINSAQAEKFTLKNSAIFLCSSAISIPYILFFFFFAFRQKIFFKKKFLLRLYLGADDYFQQKTVGLSHLLCPFIATPEQ